MKYFLCYIHFIVIVLLFYASQVCSTWKRMCERNELWKQKCKELSMNVSDYQPSAASIHKVLVFQILSEYWLTFVYFGFKFPMSMSCFSGQIQPCNTAIRNCSIVWSVLCIQCWTTVEMAVL